MIVKAGGRPPLVRRSAKGSLDVRVAALTVLRDIAIAKHSLLEAGNPPSLRLPSPDDVKFELFPIEGSKEHARLETFQFGPPVLESS